MRIARGEIIVAALFALALTISWWLAHQGILGAGRQYLVEAAVLYFFATVLFVCFGVLSDKIATVTVGLGIALGTGWFILFAHSLLGVGAAIVVFVMWLTAWIRMRQQRALILNPSFASAAHAGLTLWFLGTAVALGIASYAALPNQEVLIKKIPELLVASAHPFVERPVQKFLRIDLNAPVDDFIAQTQGLKDPKKIVVVRDAFSQQLGLKLTGNEKLWDVIQLLMERQVRVLFSVFGKYLVLGFIAVFALLSQSVAVPFFWLTVLVGPWVLKILRTLGMVEEEQQTVVRSMLRWRSSKPAS